MAWIESHQQLGRHPKLIRLAGRLKISRPQAIGHLHYLWWWSLDYAPDGSLVGMTDAEIANAAEWNKEPSEFVNALKFSVFMNDDGTLHDWAEYAGRLLDKRRTDAERKRQSRRTSDGRPTDIRVTAQVPNRTVPNLTIPIPPTPKGDEQKPVQVLTADPEPEPEPDMPVQPPSAYVSAIALESHAVFSPATYASPVVIANVKESLRRGRTADQLLALFRWRAATKSEFAPKDAIRLTDPDCFEKWQTLAQEDRTIKRTAPPKPVTRRETLLKELDQIDALRAARDGRSGLPKEQAAAMKDRADAYGDLEAERERIVAEINAEEAMKEI